MKSPRPNYRASEVKTLVEEYEELRELKGTERWRLRYLVTLADLDRSLRRMPPKEYQAVLLCGLLAIATRTAGVPSGAPVWAVGNRHAHRRDATRSLRRDHAQALSPWTRVAPKRPERRPLSKRLIDPRVYVPFADKGWSNRRIAKHLGVDESTVRRALQSIGYQ